MKNIIFNRRNNGGRQNSGMPAAQKDLPNSVFLDGDWCWDANPFHVTEETKTMVIDNICYLLNNFIHCSSYKKILFAWVMHQRSVIDSILARLDTENCTVKCISLIADESSLRVRLSEDISKGIRTADVIERSLGENSNVSNSRYDKNRYKRENHFSDRRRNQSAVTGNSLSLLPHSSTA